MDEDGDGLGRIVIDWWGGGFGNGWWMWFMVGGSNFLVVGNIDFRFVFVYSEVVSLFKFIWVF